MYIDASPCNEMNDFSEFDSFCLMNGDQVCKYDSFWFITSVLPLPDNCRHTQKFQILWFRRLKEIVSYPITLQFENWQAKAEFILPKAFFLAKQMKLNIG